MKHRCSDSAAASERGVYFITTALLIVAFIGVLGLGVDLGHIYRSKLRLQRALDAGAVAGSEYIGSDASSDAPAVAEQIARDNLEQMGMLPYLGSLRASWTNPVRRTSIRVEGTLRMPVFLLGVIPGVDRLKTVTASARAVTVRSLICMILDRSGSMSKTAGGDVKYRALQVASRNFISLFRPGHDYFSLVVFNTTADVPSTTIGGVRRTGALTTNFDYFPDLIDAATNTPNGFTNTEWALRLCRAQMVPGPEISAADFDAANKAVVLITDGAPTVSCNTNSAADVEDLACKAPIGGFKYTSIKVDYDRALLQADKIREHNPDIAVYTIGIGDLLGFNGLSPEALEATDAYQDVTKDYPLKSNFLRRAANVPQPGGSEPTTYFGSPISGVWNYINRDAEYNALNPVPPRGVYVGTNDAGELDAILQSIGLSLKARLIE